MLDTKVEGYLKCKTTKNYTEQENYTKKMNAKFFDKQNNDMSVTVTVGKKTGEARIGPEEGGGRVLDDDWDLTCDSKSYDPDRKVSHLVS